MYTTATVLNGDLFWPTKKDRPLNSRFRPASAKHTKHGPKNSPGEGSDARERESQAAAQTHTCSHVYRPLRRKREREQRPPRMPLSLGYTSARRGGRMHSIRPRVAASLLPSSSSSSSSSSTSSIPPTGVSIDWAAAFCIGCRLSHARTNSSGHSASGPPQWCAAYRLFSLDERERERLCRMSLS